MNATSLHQRLTEADLDEAIRRTQEPCDHRCAQGRYHDCPMPEYPPMNRGTLVVAVVAVLAAVLLSAWFPMGFAK